MQDDFIQGIMFSRSTYMDLRKISKSEQNLYKILALSNAPRGVTRERKPPVVRSGSPIRVGTPRIDTVAPQIIKTRRDYLHSDLDPHKQKPSQ